MTEQFGADLSRDLADRKDQHIQRYLGLQFRQDINVTIRKPRYMPNRLYRWLMRTIVVTEGPLIVYDEHALRPRWPF